MIENFQRKLGQFSLGKKLGLVISVFVIINICLLGASHFAMDTLSTVRAYVGGEGFWSKAQKNALFHLARYALFHDPGDYDSFLQHLEVPLGDKVARTELEKPSPDYRISDQGFIKGRNHPEEVRALGLLFTRFRRISYLDRAISVWARGDQLVGEIQDIATLLHRKISNKTITPEESRFYFDKIDQLNKQVTVQADAFSSTLGEAARWMKMVLSVGMVLATLLFIGLAGLLAYLVCKNILDTIRRLQEGTDRVGIGRYDQRIEVLTQDELGKLAHSFNQMTENLGRAIAEREEIHGKLMEQEKIKGEFFSNISHELRTPITLILAPLESFLSGEFGQQGEKAQKVLGIMHNNVIRLLQMVQGLLDFQKLEAKKVEVNRTPTHINQLARSLFSDFHPMMERKGLKGEVETLSPDEDSVILMDRYLFERIVFNLISNAVKFTPWGGMVTLRIKVEKNQVEVQVTDSGIGISESDQNQLFQKFRQIEGASTRRFEGAGLGLALVKEFSEILGGTVRVESSPGKGSTFTVQLAAQQVSPSGPETYSTRAGPIEQYGTTLDLQDGPSLPGSENRKVLIVEDNAELAHYMQDLIKGFCHVRLCSDGEEGLAAALSWDPKLIISDVMMPKKDGLDLCREIKANPQTQNIPFVLLTALTYREALVRGWASGADDYLFKPFHPSEFQVRVKSLLQGQELILEGQKARMKLEDELKATKENLLLTLNSMGDAVIATDSLGQVVRWNPAAEGLTGIRRHQVLNCPLREVLFFYDEKNKIPIENPVDRVLRSKTTLIYSQYAILMTQEGQEKFIAFTNSPIRDGEGNLQGVVLVLRDETHERLAQKELEHHRALLVEAQAIAHVGSFEWNLTNDQITWSDELFHIFQRDKFNFIPSLAKIEEMTHPEDRNKFQDLLKEVRAGKESVSGEMRLAREQGEYRIILVNAHLSPDSREKFSRLVGTAQDVTERREIELKMRHLDQMASLGTLAGGAAHEMNNPLAYVVANQEFVSQELKNLQSHYPMLALEIDPIRTALKEAQDGSGRLKRILKGLRSFSRMDEEESGPVNVLEVLDSAINMAMNEIKHRAQLVKRLTPVPPVEGSEQRLGQVFVNLLVNAAQAIDEGHADKNQITISTRESESGRVIVEVKDTGCGIPEEIRKKIFDPFFTTKSVGQGTGLGLSICHGIVKGLGGEIELEGRVGQGSTFRVILPGSLKTMNPPTAKATPPARPPVPEKNILIIDDEVSLAVALSRLLGQRHRIEIVDSGKKAMDKLFSGEQFDIIFCDLMMPEMTGMDVYSQLVLKRPEFASRMVFLTGGAFTPNAREFLKKISNPTLEKPFSLNEIEEAISRLSPPPKNLNSNGPS